MVTIRDVAARAGVSITTVSAVLNNRMTTVRVSNATRQRVFEAAHALGYTPNSAARALRAPGTPRTILLYLAHDRSSHFITEVLRGIQSFLGTTPYRLSMEPFSGGTLADVMRQGVPSGTAGVLVAGTNKHDDATLTTLPRPAGGLPLVLLGRPAPAETFSAVYADQRAGAAAATAYLLSLGHRQIGYLTRQLDTAAIEERFAGFQDALTRAGLRVNRDPVVETSAFTEAGGRAAMQQLLRSPASRQLTAVFAAGDVLALGAMQAAHNAGYAVGPQLSLAGFDDIPVASFVDPPLATVHLPVKEIGSEAVRLLVAQIEGRAGRPAVHILDAPFVARASCMPPGDASRPTLPAVASA